MTKRQKEWALDAFRSMAALPGNEKIEMFMSLTGIVRIQDRKNRTTESHTRMFCILDDDSREEIEKKIRQAVYEIREATEK